MMHVQPHKIAQLTPNTPRWRKIVIWVARRHRVSVTDILGPSRFKMHVEPRMLAMCLIWRHPQTQHISLAKMARLFGNRHHTTARESLITLLGKDGYVNEAAIRRERQRAKRAAVEAALRAEKKQRPQASEDARKAGKIITLGMLAERRAQITPLIFIDRIGLGMSVLDTAKKHGISDNYVKGVVRDVVAAACRGDAVAIALVEQAVGRTIEYALPQLRERHRKHLTKIGVLS